MPKYVVSVTHTQKLDVAAANSTEAFETIQRANPTGRIDSVILEGLPAEHTCAACEALADGTAIRSENPPSPPPKGAPPTGSPTGGTNPTLIQQAA